MDVRTSLRTGPPRERSVGAHSVEDPELPASQQ
jgi:hypothetical protein